VIVSPSLVNPFGSKLKGQGIRTACVEILESKFGRILFSVVDTPGLDFRPGKELRLERQVTGIVKYIDAQYYDTLTEVCPFQPS
jgi:hypothetical protein